MRYIVLRLEQRMIYYKKHKLRNININEIQIDFQIKIFEENCLNLYYAMNSKHVYMFAMLLLRIKIIY